MTDLVARAIVELLAARAPDATICPSEAARRLHPDAWREHMDDVRATARRLAREGVIELTQRGRVVDPDGPFRGPIRLRAGRRFSG